MKTLFTTTIACALASTLTAGSVLTPCEPNPPPKPEPCEKKCEFKCDSVKFDILAGFLFLQPNGSKLYYGAEAITLNPNLPTPVAAVSPSWNILEIKPKYHGAIDIGAKFSFIPTSLNLIVNFEHFQAKDKASFTAPLTSEMVGPINDIGPNSSHYQSAFGSVSFVFDMLNLLVGKQVSFFQNAFANFYVGAALGLIQQTNYSNFSNTSTSITRSIKAPSQFAGVGPQFGFDFAVRVCDCFYFDGGFSSSMLMGQLKNSTTYKSNAPILVTLGVPEPNTQTTSVPKRSQLIPGFEQRVGFSFVTPCTCGTITVGAGYLAQIYLNAIQSMDMTAPQVLPSLAAFTVDAGVYAVGFARTLSNFSLSGPYVIVGFAF